MARERGRVTKIAEGKTWEVIEGDVKEVCKLLEANAFDAVLCDPPYGLSNGPVKTTDDDDVAKVGFMGREWDRGVPGPSLWKEVLRVAKPGAPLIAFFGSRTYHRGAVAIEDAGFEIRDMMMWLYGSGFPKSHDVGRALDDAAGAERTKVRVDASDVRNPKSLGGGHGIDGGDRPWMQEARRKGFHEVAGDEPVTELAKRWDGYGTALKPAHEPAVLGRKPLEGTVAKNVEKWGAGGLAIAASRNGDETMSRGKSNGIKVGKSFALAGHDTGRVVVGSATGRWPTNVLLDEEAAIALDLQVGSGPRGDEGPSRFFYTAKAKRGERGAGNDHPTVKPMELMRYLSRLALPPHPEAKILVPFCGSGSEMLGAMLGGWNHVVGIELDPHNAAIARKRIVEAQHRVL